MTAAARETPDPADLSRAVMAALRFELTGWRHAIAPEAMQAIVETFPAVIEQALERRRLGPAGIDDTGDTVETVEYRAVCTDDGFANSGNRDACEGQASIWRQQGYTARVESRSVRTVSSPWRPVDGEVSP